MLRTVGRFFEICSQIVEEKNECSCKQSNNNNNNHNNNKFVNIFFCDTQLQKFMSFWALPEHCIVHIFGYLDVPNLMNVSLTCKTFNKLASTDTLWKDQ